MRLLHALAILVACLGLQAAVGRAFPGATQYLDLMLVPATWFGLRGSQPWAMAVGCTAGLLQDVWFQSGLLGFNGFKKTLLGWAIGVLGSRWDLNHRLGQFGAGAVLSIADHWLGVGILRLLGQRAPIPAAAPVFLRALAMGLILALVFVMFDRAKKPAKPARAKTKAAIRPF